MVVYAVAKPYLFEIFLESEVLRVVFITVVIGVYGLEHVADGQVLRIVLVPEDVAAPKGGFLQVIYEYLLIESQILEIGHLVAEHLDVGKAVYRVVKVVGGSFLCRTAARRCHHERCHCCCDKKLFHRFIII